MEVDFSVRLNKYVPITFAIVFLSLNFNTTVYAEIFKLIDCYNISHKSENTDGWKKYGHNNFLEQDTYKEYIFKVDTEKEIVLIYLELTDKYRRRMQEMNDMFCEEQIDLTMCKTPPKIMKETYFISSINDNLVETLKPHQSYETFFINIKDGSVLAQSNLGSERKMQCDAE